MFMNLTSGRKVQFSCDSMTLGPKILKSGVPSLKGKRVVAEDSEFVKGEEQKNIHSGKRSAKQGLMGIN